MSLPDSEYLNECFNYNPDTGSLVWKIRPEHHFENERAMKLINTRQAGKLAGSTPSETCQSHVRVLGKYYSVKKIIWKLMTGEEPKWHLRFKDGNSSNLSFTNIIPISDKPIFSTGYKWVTKVNKSFVANVSHHSIRYYVGVFETAELAYEASLRKKEELLNAI